MRLIHLINPFKCERDNPSFLYYAQPITFHSMHIAQEAANKHGINVELYAINYPEDDEIIPSYITKLPHLTKSSRDIMKLPNGKKLPLLQEMFDSVRNIPADYFIFTNSDIGLQQNFYVQVSQIIQKQKLHSFVINRRDGLPKVINRTMVGTQHLARLYAYRGLPHPGKDCFVMKKEYLAKIKMGSLFTGYPPWGEVLHRQLEKINKKHYMFTNLFLTFHIGSDIAWTNIPKGRVVNPYRKQNKISARQLGYHL